MSGNRDVFESRTTRRWRLDLADGAEAQHKCRGSPGSVVRAAGPKPARGLAVQINCECRGIGPTTSSPALTIR